ncbi:MAG: hypothetical protein CL406_07570 [Acidimicrobiaceae bacterium]|nr:hypothetical protein [Acidimicrobiaceae bacterium]MDP6481509.1 TSUP family transporter [Acidimicrobiales bacterium]MDP6696420.1 TSUP family transporter [Acidimicrobiales bacterium]
MTLVSVLLLLAGGLGAGIVNTMAGGGSLLTVPLLVLAGVPGTVANGSNRVGILTSTATATVGFRRLGYSGLSRALPVLVPVAVGAVIGAVLVGQLTDEAFERAFGFLMVPLLLISLRPPRVSASSSDPTWSGPVSAIVFLGIGIYGGAFQAGIGLLLVLALSRSGVDLVLANSIKVMVVLAVTVMALPVFVIGGSVDWGPALVLAVGYAVGGFLGARVTVTGGEKVIRPVLVVVVVGFAGRLVGLY